MTAEAALRPEPSGPSLREHAVAQGLCLLLLVFVFRLWRADLRVPFAYEGDAFFTFMLTKGGIDAGWYFTNPLLGAPFRLEMFDHPSAGTLHFTLLKLFSWITRDAFLSVNLYYLFGYFLCTFSALAVLRRLGLGPVTGTTGALLFAFQPYHLIRGEVHLFLASYYAVPPAILLAYWVANGRIRFGWPLNRRAVAALGICVLLASTSIYYVFFTGVLLLVHGVLASRRLRTPRAMRRFGLELRSLATPLVLGAALAGAFALCISPNLISMAQKGRNSAAVNRNHSESETYGLRFGSVLLPVPDHRIPALSEMRARYDRHTTSIEANASALGVVAGSGFVLLLGALFRRRRDELCRFLSESNLSLLLLGVTGGVGSLFALFVTPLIRAYSRVSVFLAFLGLALIFSLIERALPWLEQRVKRSYAAHALCGVLLVLGVFDQMTPRFLPDYAARRATFDSDRDFIQKVEAAVPAGGSLFVLPYLAFPESFDRIATNELFRGYLHSRRLRFSAGTMIGSNGSLWQQDVAAEPPPMMVETLALAGFDGIYVDRRGIAEPAVLEAALTPLLGKSLTSRDQELQFYSLETVKRRLQATPAWASRESVKRRVVARFTGLYLKERAGPRVWRWSAGEAELLLSNPDSRPRNVTISFRAYGVSPEITALRLSGAVRGRLALGTERPVYEASLRVPVGGAKVTFQVEGTPRMPSANDSRVLAFAIEDFTLRSD